MEEMISEGEHVEYTPPEGYCGPSRFLRDGLVHEAIPFFDKINERYSLSSQGKDIVTKLVQGMRTTPSRNMLVLRLSYSFGAKDNDDTSKKKNKAIYQFLNNIADFPELSDFLIVVDKSEKVSKNKQVISEKIQWSNPNYWRGRSNVPTILVIDQTCSRSTEWSCHNRIFAMHDFRNVIQYSTISQAQERVNHYEQRYGGFQPILV